MLDEDLATIVSQLPPSIRAFFASGKVGTIAKSLMQKNQLHIDHGAILSREIILLLLGINDPAEFSKALAEEAKLDQRTINGIVEDVNTQIFMPLRDEMRKETAAAPEQPRTFFHLENKIPLPRQNRPTEEKPPQILIPAAPVSPKPALRDVLASVMKAPSDDNHISPEPRQLLEDHEEPHIEFRNKTRAAAPPTQPTPPKPITSYSTDPYREPIDEK